MTEQTTISGNVAAGDVSNAGGGLWIQNVSATLDAEISSALFLSNRASGNGGGLFLSNSGEISIRVSGGSISRNIAGASGGGAYLIESNSGKGTLNREGVTVFNNTAGTLGGGLYVSSGRGTQESALNNCAVNGNTVDSGSGGGIWSGGSSDILMIRSGTIVTQNKSGAGNGGGIYFNSDDGELILSGNAKITYNQANARESSFGSHGGGICVVPGRVEIRDQVEIAYNIAGRFGGGLSAAEESFIMMSGGTIHDNQSEQEGGGVWNHISSQFTQTGGSIKNNAALIGGGFYNDANSTVSILGGTIQENTVSRYAPGVYNAGTLYTQGLRELENGLYIEDRDAVAYLSGALEAGTTLQLETSGYVASNATGTPIVVGEATSQYPVLPQTDANGFRKPPTGFENWEIRLSGDSRQVLLIPLEYTIRYENTLGADNPNPGSYTGYTPTITLLPLADTPSEHFLGWFDAPEGGTQVTEIPLGSSGDKTLYAQWEAAPLVLYTLTYCANDAGGPPARCVPGPRQVLAGQSVQISCCIPYRTCCSFAGWNTHPCGAGQMVWPGQTVGPVTGDISLYAQWKCLPPHSPAET